MSGRAEQRDGPARARSFELLDLGLVFLAGAIIPVEVFLIMQGIYGVAIATTGIIILGLVALVIGWNPEPQRMTKPKLDLRDTVAVSPMPLNIRVEATRGVCALGYRVGDEWAVDQEGRVLASLCPPAVAALAPVLHGMSRKGRRQEARCKCPLGDRQVTFSVGRRNGY